MYSAGIQVPFGFLVAIPVLQDLLNALARDEDNHGVLGVPNPPQNSILDIGMMCRDSVGQL